MSWLSGPLRVNAAALAFWAWCSLLSYPLITQGVDLAEAVHEYRVNPIIVVCQTIGLVVFMLTMFASRLGYFVSTFCRFSLPQRCILFIIYLSFFLQLHGNETSILIGIFYNALVLLTVSAVSVLWTLPLDRLERCLGIAAIIFCLFGVFALVILGWPKDRNVGSIQPNLFAAPLLVAFLLSLFRPGLAGVIVRVLCLGMIALVSSRYSLVGCMTAILLFELTHDPLNPTKIPVVVVAIIAAFIFWPQIVSIMALDDSGRDLSSGFSGRDLYWDKAFKAISTNPFGIGFKRAIGDESGHNGYLKTILEFGVVGGGLIIFFIACETVLAGIEAISSPLKLSRQHRFACARFSGLAALVFGAFFQPQLLSLGDSFAMLLLFLLFRPGANALPDQIKVSKLHKSDARPRSTSPADTPALKIIPP
jgi:hypothetical protein